MESNRTQQHRCTHPCRQRKPGGDQSCAHSRPSLSHKAQGCGTSPGSLDNSSRSPAFAAGPTEKPWPVPTHPSPSLLQPNTQAHMAPHQTTQMPTRDVKNQPYAGCWKRNSILLSPAIPSVSPPTSGLLRNQHLSCSRARLFTLRTPSIPGS